ncbi:hypothetical protein M0R01_00265 [bacterium]|nr:hypothetical protein [bacterium]
MISKKISILIIATSIFIGGVSFAAVCENQILNFEYDIIPTSLNEQWFVCPYSKLIIEQTALYKSMENVHWISIEKIGGNGEIPDPVAAKSTYCLNSIGKQVCDNTGGRSLENPGIVQKIDLWRQRLKTYLESKNLRPYYDSQIAPKNPIYDRYDENRMALLDLLSDTRDKLEECVTGYNMAYSDNSAIMRLFTCQEGVTVNSANSYRITPDFPYPTHSFDLNCFPFNADYITRIEKEQCARNKDRSGGCQSILANPSLPYASDSIFKTYLDDFYCGSGRQTTGN